jgi:hypothetical protein
MFPLRPNGNSQAGEYKGSAMVENFLEYMADLEYNGSRQKPR